MKDESIAIDLGGTLKDTWHEKRIWFGVRGFDIGPWPRSRLEIVRDIGGNQALYEQMAAEVYSDANILQHNLAAGAREAIGILGRRFRIVIVSSRTEQRCAATSNWLQRHRLTTLIDEIVFLGNGTNKLTWCLRAGIDALIDDDIRH